MYIYIYIYIHTHRLYIVPGGDFQGTPALLPGASSVTTLLTRGQAAKRRDLRKITIPY